jgi:AraC-like DNA-binding protein
MSLLNFFKEFVSNHRQNDPTSKTVFDHYFFDSKYYLQPTASSEDFAPLLNIDPRSLDKMAVAYYGHSFTMLINEYRYNHFVKELIHPINENLTIDSLIKLSGFDNNESFVKYAKEKQQNA